MPIPKSMSAMPKYIEQIDSTDKIAKYFCKYAAENVSI
jgi:hypothetical protein